MLVLYDKNTLFFAVNTRYTTIGDVVMYYTTMMGEGTIVVTALLLLFLIPYFRNWWFFATAVACSIVPFLIQQWLKVLFSYPRPQTVFKGNNLLHHLPDWPILFQNSFPSGHSEGAFSFFCLLSLSLPEKYKQWGLLFFVLAIAVCYSRIYLAAHFFEDVYAGSIIGGVFTTLVYSVMFYYKDRMFTPKNTLT